MNSHNAVLVDSAKSPYAQLKPVSMSNIALADGFWRTRQLNNDHVTIPTQFQLLESTGRLDNFRRVTGGVNEPYQGYVFSDSDVYKWLEAACWSMVYNKDAELNQQIDLVIDLIAHAQDKDGYLNTYFSLDKIRERWMNLQEKHELYCAGHLIKAAITHHRVTGEDNLLNIALRLANHICKTFGKSQVEGTSGHPEIELALVELYRETREEKYLNQAALFLDRRGYGLLGSTEYLLDHIPFRQMEKLTGHAVRALYLCSGATDLLLETGEEQVRHALERLWENMISQQMYITGGVGARHDGEAFGQPYELPNSRAYAETCAAIANVMWNWRMLNLNANPRYADLVEWALYNAVLPGISLDGKQYFYTNPLADDGFHRRENWFDCACCPPNVARTLAEFPGYLYSISQKGIWVHQYVPSTATIELMSGIKVTLEQITKYPWDGLIKLQINNLVQAKPSEDRQDNSRRFSIFLRIPGWVADQRPFVKINGKSAKLQVHPGSYLEIEREWSSGDKLELSLPMEVRYVESHPLEAENKGCLAITRGPLVYCLEQADHPRINLAEIRIDPIADVTDEFDPDFLGGVTKLHLHAFVDRIDSAWENLLYRNVGSKRTHSKERSAELLSIPYFAWANRQPGSMAIWHLKAGK